MLDTMWIERAVIADRAAEVALLAGRTVEETCAELAWRLERDSSAEPIAMLGEMLSEIRMQRARALAAGCHPTHPAATSAPR